MTSNMIAITQKSPSMISRLNIFQSSTDTNIPGNRAVWVGIYAEMFEFALCFILFFIAKVHYAEVFHDGPQKLNTIAGTINTLALISSSYCVAKAMIAIRQNKPKISIRWLWATIFFAALYLGIKLWEYQWNSKQGIFSDTNEFFTVYYYITFNHLLHVGWGSGAILWIIYRLNTGAYSADDHEGMEAVACYWHMIDLVWIIIFPLLYAFR